MKKLIKSGRFPEIGKIRKFCIKKLEPFHIDQIFTPNNVASGNSSSPYARCTCSVRHVAERLKWTTKGSTKLKKT